MTIGEPERIVSHPGWKTSVRPTEGELHLFASDGYCRDGQFRSDLRKPRDYKRDNMQNRNPSLNVSTCVKQRKMICHSSDHLFQSWRTAGSSRTRNSSERSGSWQQQSTKRLRCICSFPSQPTTYSPRQCSRT